MFYSRQVYTSLAESTSNYVFKEEKKIDLDSSKIAAITEGSSSLHIRNFQKYLQISWFFAKLRLDIYNFTKNELFCIHFSDNFT